MTRGEGEEKGKGEPSTITEGEWKKKKKGRKEADASCIFVLHRAEEGGKKGKGTRHWGRISEEEKRKER